MISRHVGVSNTTVRVWAIRHGIKLPDACEKIKDPTIEDLRAVYAYDPNTGILRLKVKRQQFAAGHICGTLVKGSFRLKLSGKFYAVHRVIWALVYGYWPINMIDHINGNPSDNRIENLREANCLENAWNSRKPSTNTSGYKGVSFCRKTNKWHSRIMANGVRYSLGLYLTPEAAYAKYCTAAHKLHREFARVD